MEAKFTDWLVDKIRELVIKEINRYVKNPPGLNPWHRHGTIQTVSGLPTVLFDGEDEATSRKYPYIEAYTASNPPQPGDRVYLAKSGNTWIVIGKIKYQ